MGGRGGEGWGVGCGVGEDLEDAGRQTNTNG